MEFAIPAFHTVPGAVRAVAAYNQFAAQVTGSVGNLGGFDLAKAFSGADCTDLRR
jgi:hypothetical protein